MRFHAKPRRPARPVPGRVGPLFAQKLRGDQNVVSTEEACLIGANYRYDKWEFPNTEGITDTLTSEM